jgi:hypothetical protein
MLHLCNIKKAKNSKPMKRALTSATVGVDEIDLKIQLVENPDNVA